METVLREYVSMLKVLAAAAVVTLMTSRVGIRPPGGISRQDDPLGHVKYVARLALIWPNTYSCLIVLNTMAFYGSLIILLLLTCDIPLQMRKAFTRPIVIVWATISSVSLAYTAALSVLISNVRNYEAFEDDSIFCVSWLILAIWGLPTLLLVEHVREKIPGARTDSPMAYV